MNTEGTKSTYEWTTDADITQQATATAESDGSRGIIASMAGYDASSSAASVLTCMPGTIPLNVPMAQPSSAISTHNAVRVGSMMDPSDRD